VSAPADGQTLASLMQALQANPTHYDTLMRLGAMLAEGGNAPAARTVFTQAVHAHPKAAAPYACLGTLLADDGEHARAMLMFESALAIEPAYREAVRGAAVIHEREGELDAAEHMWRRAFPNGSLEVSPYTGTGSPVRVLYVTSALGGNIPMQHVLDSTTFEVATLIAESIPPDVTLPPHDVLFNAIGDADRCERALHFAERICALTHAPVINEPAIILLSTRLRNSERLRALPGVVTARMAHVNRADIAASDGPAHLTTLGFSWPLLLRSLGFQTGEHFERIDDARALPAALEALPGRTLLAIEYVDSRAADGAFRKYRVMTIGGKLYPVHLAISDGWKVHYFRSAMPERAAFRDEEAAFLADMSGVLGACTVAVLESIAQLLAVDYGGMDFSVLPDGNVLVFEANATMVLVPPKADAHWDYRRPAFARAIEAARAVLTMAK
jgi:tetratricopeptide (TPR) repeat protein